MIIITLALKVAFSYHWNPLFTYFTRRKVILSNKEIIFSTGPAIEVQIEILNQQIKKISLYPNSKSNLTASFLASKKTDAALESQIESWLKAYVRREQPSVLLFLDKTLITPFTLQVLGVIESIPFGSALSYKQVAEKLNHSKASRAVGNACGRNPYPLIIPCHRVLASGHFLGGFSEDIEVKKRLLAFEDIPFKQKHSVY